MHESFYLAGTGKSDEKVDLTRENKLAQFNNWFTWCHNCRHGGHAGHMLSWFRWDSLDAAYVHIIFRNTRTWSCYDLSTISSFDFFFFVTDIKEMKNWLQK